MNNASRKPGIPRWLIILSALFLLGFIGIAVWNDSASGPTPEALAALEPESSVTVTATDDLITFEPSDGTADVGLIFYPGGKVDFRAYAPALHLVAGQGYAVFTPSMPLYLAFFDVNAADSIIAAHPEITTWAIGGHSLGGVAAASYAANHPAIDGVVFWASYPANDALKQSQVQVLSIYGTRDGLSTVDKVNASRSNLPADTQFLAIEGGNHAQFGSYGPQEGDNQASIAANSQWQQAADATAAFLSTLER